MGQTREWKCNQCGYKLPMSGGSDGGFFIVTNTFCCKSCQKLMDITIRRFEPKRRFGPPLIVDEDDEPYVFPWREFKAYQISRIKNIFSKKNKNGIEVIPKCHFCQGEVVEWDSEIKPCPCCDGQMETNGKVLRYWD